MEEQKLISTKSLDKITELRLQKMKFIQDLNEFKEIRFKNHEQLQKDVFFNISI